MKSINLMGKSKISIMKKLTFLLINKTLKISFIKSKQRIKDLIEYFFQMPKISGEFIIKITPKKYIKKCNYKINKQFLQIYHSY
jgi:hypothetical protein